MEAFGQNVEMIWRRVKPIADVAIVAGDIHSRLFEEQLTEIASKFKKVFAVKGNHEWYGRDISWAPNRSKLPDNVNVLQSTAEKYEDVWFFGDTLWTDFKHEDPLIKLASQHGINDFKAISHGMMKFTPDACVLMHQKQRKYLELMIRETQGQRRVVVTHFLPSYETVAPQWKNGSTDALNYYFSSSCDDLIDLMDGGHWVFGHTHDHRDLKLGEVQMFCNPVGYPREGVPYTDKVIQV